MSKTTVSENELSLSELKRRAKQLKADTAEQTHQQRLETAAKEVGFRDFRHARRVLTGQVSPGDDFGTFWHTRPSGGFLNEWHANYQEAQTSWSKQPLAYLLPYRTQFVIVGQEFMTHLGIETSQLAHSRDLLSEAGQASWDVVCCQRIRALHREAIAR